MVLSKASRMASSRSAEIDPLTGLEIQAIIARMYAMPRAVVERAKAVVGSQPAEEGRAPHGELCHSCGL